MNAFLREQLEIYFMEHPAEAEVFTGRVLNNKRSRESAESQKNLMRRKFNTVVDLSNRVEKFVNCRTKDVARRELYIVEGDSAMTSVKLARDPEFQAVIRCAARRSTASKRITTAFPRATLSPTRSVSSGAAWR